MPKWWNTFLWLTTTFPSFCQSVGSQALSGVLDASVLYRAMYLKCYSSFMFLCRLISSHCRPKPPLLFLFSGRVSFRLKWMSKLSSPMPKPPPSPQLDRAAPRRALLDLKTVTWRTKDVNVQRPFCWNSWLRLKSERTKTWPSFWTYAHGIRDSFLRKWIMWIFLCGGGESGEHRGAPPLMCTMLKYCLCTRQASSMQCKATLLYICLFYSFRFLLHFFPVHKKPINYF